ncbi:guanylate kinase [Rhodopirellula sp.]|nr:guanylate kinase [Rhodopirellula sp.]
MNGVRKGRLVIISGPSGAGKSTVVRQLLDRCRLPLKLSVSATTRPARAGEIDGVHYHFLDGARFNQLRDAGDFLECKEVFGLGYWYGTLREQVATGLNEGSWVILEIDVQGAMTLLDEGEFDPITLFVHTGGLESLESRLRGRETEDEEVISRRLSIAAEEIEFMHRYQYQIINDSVDRAVDEICQRLREHREH